MVSPWTNASAKSFTFTVPDDGFSGGGREEAVSKNTESPSTLGTRVSLLSCVMGDRVVERGELR